MLHYELLGAYVDSVEHIEGVLDEKEDAGAENSTRCCESGLEGAVEERDCNLSAAFYGETCRETY